MRVGVCRNLLWHIGVGRYAFGPFSDASPLESSRVHWSSLASTPVLETSGDRLTADWLEPGVSA